MHSCSRKVAAFLSAILLFFASAACCEDQPGIASLGLAADSRIVTGNLEKSPEFASDNGGLTWTQIHPVSGLKVQWDGDAAETEQGLLSIVGSEIYRTDNGNRTLFKSFDHLGKASNKWAQLDAIGRRGCEQPTVAPLAMVVDPASKNLIIAMGDLGVVVVDPNGSWTEVGVGDYAPVDFSYSAKLNRLSANGLWLGAAAAATLFTAWTVIFFFRWRWETLLSVAAGLAYFILATASVVLLFAFYINVLDPLIPNNLLGLENDVVWVFLSIVLVWGGALTAVRLPSQHYWRMGAGITCALFGILIYWFINYGLPGDWLFSNMSSVPGLAPGERSPLSYTLVMNLPILGFSLTALGLTCPPRHWAAICSAGLSSYLALTGSYLIWLADLVPTFLLTLNPMFAILIALAIYLRKKDRLNMTSDATQ